MGRGSSAGVSSASGARVPLAGAQSISRDCRATKRPLLWGQRPHSGGGGGGGGSQAPGAPLTPHGCLQPLWGEKKQVPRMGAGAGRMAGGATSGGARRPLPCTWFRFRRI